MAVRGMASSSRNCLSINIYIKYIFYSRFCIAANANGVSPISETGTVGLKGRGTPAASGRYPVLCLQRFAPVRIPVVEQGQLRLDITALAGIQFVRLVEV